MKFILKDEEVELKFSIRAMIMYENIEDKSFAPSNLTDILTFFYCIVLTSSKDYSLTFDEFIDIIDANPEYVTQFNCWLTTVDRVNDNIKKK